MSASAREDAAKRSKMRSPRMTSDSEHRQLEITILETRLKQAHEANARAKRAKQQTSDARLSTMKWLRDEKAEALHQAKLATVKALILQLEEDTAIAVLSEQQGYEVERSPAKSFRAGTDSGDDEMKRILAGIVLPAASSHRAEEEHKQTQETEGGQSKALESDQPSLHGRHEFVDPNSRAATAETKAEEPQTRLIQILEENVREARQQAAEARRQVDEARQQADEALKKSAKKSQEVALSKLQIQLLRESADKELEQLRERVEVAEKLNESFCAERQKLIRVIEVGASALSDLNKNRRPEIVEVAQSIKKLEYHAEWSVPGIAAMQHHDDERSIIRFFAGNKREVNEEIQDHMSVLPNSTTFLSFHPTPDANKAVEAICNKWQDQLRDKAKEVEVEAQWAEQMIEDSSSQSCHWLPLYDVWTRRGFVSDVTRIMEEFVCMDTPAEDAVVDVIGSLAKLNVAAVDIESKADMFFDERRRSGVEELRESEA